MQERAIPQSAERVPPRLAGHRVLVVEDSSAQRKMLSLQLHRLGYAVETAESGEAALAICRQRRIDMVLSDWMMPGMDGVAFCRAFRALEREGYGYFILLTSKSETGEVAVGLDAGADDFLTKPVHANELRARLAAGERIIAMERALSERNRVVSATLAELRTFYAALDRDLEQARVLQESLVPERHRDFGAVSISLMTRPCGTVGGDMVGMFSPADGRVGLYAIDVAGHGVSAAMMTARICGYLSGRSDEQNLAVACGPDGVATLRDPTEVAARLNELLLADGDTDQYITMAYATVEPATGRVHLVQAGHPHPLLQRADSRVERVGAGGPPIGLLGGCTFAGTELTLAPGERLLFYSDGFTEAADGRGAMLEEGGLARRLAARRSEMGTELLDALFADLACYAGAREMDDDISAVLVEYAVAGV